MTEAAGTLAEEAAKLLGAAEEWWRAHAPAAPAHAETECRICPFCQVVAAVRQPEVVEHLATAGTALLLALKAAVEAQERAWPRRRTDIPVERIDIA